MRVVRVLAGVGLLIGSFAFAAPVAAGDPCFHDMSRPPVSEDAVAVVKMDKCAFFPTIAHVPVGTEVRFINGDVVGHEIVGANLTWGHHDKVLGTDDQLAVKFAKAGTYPYTCMIHPGMTGAIIVGDAASAAAAPGGATVVEPAPGDGAAAQPPAEPASTSAQSGSFGLVAGVLGVAIATFVAVLAGSLAIRRRRSTEVRPTA